MPAVSVATEPAARGPIASYYTANATLDPNKQADILARVSGVANATISQIEAGRLNPTVSMLKKVLDGIPMPLAEFFADDIEAGDRIFFRAEDLIEIAEGGEADETMEECATTGDHYYHAGDGDTLRAAFRDIALKIATLRLVQ